MKLKEVALFPIMKASGIDRLGVPERILLVQDLRDSSAETPDQVTLTEAQEAGLDHRLAAYEAEPRAGSTREGVKAHLGGNHGLEDDR